MVSSSDVIGMSGMSALLTKKQIPLGTILFADVMTTGTFPGTVPGISPDNWNTSSPGFIADKSPKLSKCPAMETTPLYPTGPYPAGNSLELLKSNSTAGAFGTCDDLFRNNVISMGGKSLFLMTAFAK